STCEGAPPCQRTTIRFAFAGKWGKPGRGGIPEAGSAPRPPTLGELAPCAKPSCCRRLAKAAIPMPLDAVRPKNWRRERRKAFSSSGFMFVYLTPRPPSLPARSSLGKGGAQLLACVGKRYINGGVYICE